MIWKKEGVGGGRACKWMRAEGRCVCVCVLRRIREGCVVCPNEPSGGAPLVFWRSMNLFISLPVVVRGHNVYILR